MTKQKRETLTEEQIINIQKKMEEAKQKPIEKRVYTKKETVLKLKKHILEMQKKGYSLDDIRLFFEKNGLVISLSSLKSYLGNTGTRKAKKDGNSTTVQTSQNDAAKDIKKDTKSGSVAEDKEAEKRTTVEHRLNFDDKKAAYDNDDI